MWSSWNTNKPEGCFTQCDNAGKIGRHDNEFRPEPCRTGAASARLSCQAQAREEAEAERLRRSELEAAADGTDADEANGRFKTLKSSDRAAYDAIIKADTETARDSLGILRWGPLGRDARRQVCDPCWLKAFLEWGKIIHNRTNLEVSPLGAQL